MMFNKGKILGGLLLFCFFFTSISQAEDFRVHKMNIIELSSPFEKKTAVLGVNDALCVTLPEDQTFIEGLEVSLKVPDIVLEWRDSVAWSLYSNISPAPAEDKIDYSGTRIEVGTFEGNTLYTVKIPTKSDNSITSDKYSRLVSAVAQNEGRSVFFRLQLAMKGASDSITDSRFEVTAAPIVSDKGLIILDAQSEDGELKSFSVFIDEKQRSLDNGSILIPEGNHTLSIVSDFYRNEVRTVSVERAKSTKVNITLRDIKPVVRLVAPENTQIVFDEREIPPEERTFPTTQGEHTVKFYVGDYEITKTLSLENGKNYNVSINMEAIVTEESN